MRSELENAKQALEQMQDYARKMGFGSFPCPTRNRERPRQTLPRAFLLLRLRCVRVLKPQHVRQILSANSTLTE